MCIRVEKLDVDHDVHIYRITFSAAWKGRVCAIMRILKIIVVHVESVSREWYHNYNTMVGPTVWPRGPPNCSAEPEERMYTDNLSKPQWCPSA